MSLATAPRYAPGFEELTPNEGLPGVQGLLRSPPPRPDHVARVVAVAFYAFVFGLVVTYGFRAAENPIEEQNIIELAPIPAEDIPDEEPPPPEELDEPEPPPPEPEALEPLPEVKPPPPKPVQQPKPKVEKERPRVGPRPAAPAARAPAAPAGATTSAIANSFHACMQRAASNAYPETQAPRRARIGYRAIFGATGSLISYSITSSGNGAFDAVANRLGGRCGTVPAPGRTISLSGALTFSP